MFASYLTPTETQFALSVTSMAVTMPAAILKGDLLIALVEVRNSGTWTKPSGWSDISTLSQAGGGAVGKLNGFYKIADGTETGTTPTWTASTGTSADWQVLKVTNWHGVTPPEAATTSGDATAANPPSLTPSWGSDNTLWIAVAGHAAASAAAWSAGPASYSGFDDTGASSGGAAVSLATAYRNLAASSEDPGAFTVSGSNRFWAAATIAVRSSTITLGTSGGTQAATQTVSTTANTTKFVGFFGVHQGTISSATLNGTAMTRRASAATAFNETIEIWDLDSPGALSSVTLTATFTGGSGDVVGYVNVESSATGAPDNSATATGSSTTASVSITPTVDHCLVLGGMYAEAAPTQGASETSIFIVQGQSFENAAASYVVQTQATAQVVDWTLSSGQRWAVAAISIAPTGGSPPPATVYRSTLPLLGIG